MSTTFTRTRFAAMLLCAVWAATDVTVTGFPARAEDLDFCARPVPPECAEMLTRKAPSDALAACKIDVDRYVKMTFSYRRCLARQLENEVRRTNAILDRFRCISGGAGNARNCAAPDR